MLRLLGLDQARWGTPDWNPLGELARPGQTILLKPNWVSHRIHNTSTGEDRILDYLVTHTAIIRAFIDYAYIAVGEHGRIIIADAPIQGTDFTKLINRCFIPEVQSFYSDIDGCQLEIIDLRLTTIELADDGRILEHHKMEGDPLGYKLVDLSSKSMLVDLDEWSESYRVFDYDEKDIQKSHQRNKHQYLISRTVLTADCVINLPKLKTHIKTGITGALKNLVGINGNKAYLPHYRIGSPAEHGDEYPIHNILKRIKSQYRYKLAHFPWIIREPIRRLGNTLFELSRFRQTVNNLGGVDPYLVSAGNWYGNDTAWRMVIDINFVLMFANSEGEIQRSQQRRWLSVVDGIIAGEGNGPLSPDPRPLGRLIGGFNPVEVDAVCAQLIGLDWRKLPLLAKGYQALFGHNNLDLIKVMDNHRNTFTLREIYGVSLKVPDGWRGFIERSEQSFE